EDLAFLRALPNMAVVCPGDPVEVRLALRAAVARGGPVYLRLGKKGEPRVHKDAPPFAIGRVIVLRPGRDVCLLCTGTLLPVRFRHEAGDHEYARRHCGLTEQQISLALLRAFRS